MFSFIFDVFTLVLVCGLIFGVLTMWAVFRYGSWAEWLFDVFQRKVVNVRPPNLVIRGSRGDDTSTPYLVRWFLIPRNPICNIYLHHFLRSDHDVPHDHPWWSVSLMLKNWLYENSPDKEMTIIREGSWTWRNATYAHQIVVPEPLLGREGAWTLFITGPRFRDWGFHCPKGWVPHEEFIDADGKGLDGAGCGEKA